MHRQSELAPKNGSYTQSDNIGSKRVFNVFFTSSKEELSLVTVLLHNHRVYGVVVKKLYA